MLYVGLILITIFSGVLSYFIAERRNADKKFWLVMGIVFGPFALPFVFMAKKLRSECIV